MFILLGKEHLDRFFNSALTVGIPIKESKEEILKIISELVTKTALSLFLSFLPLPFTLIPFTPFTPLLPVSFPSTLSSFLCFLKQFLLGHFRSVRKEISQASRGGERTHSPHFCSISRPLSSFLFHRRSNCRN